MLPVNPPSPAFRGVRGLRRTKGLAAGPLAPLFGLHSRRKMTSLNRPAPRSPHTPDAIGSVLRCEGCLVGLRGVCLRGLWLFGDKTRASYFVIQCVFWCCHRAALAARYDYTIISFCSPLPVWILCKISSCLDPQSLSTAQAEQKRTESRDPRSARYTKTQGLHSALRVTTKQHS